jgi:hypothetical protein
MSDHVWALENIAAYLAGGLDPTEGERLEQHAAQCAVCARALDEARSLENKLAPLFRAAKPGAALEDRIIQSLLMAPPEPIRRRLYHLSMRAKAGLAIAAGLLIAFIGYGVSQMIEEDRLGFPGQDRVLASKSPYEGRTHFGALKVTTEHGINFQASQNFNGKWKRLPPGVGRMSEGSDLDDPNAPNASSGSDATANTVKWNEAKAENALKTAAELAKEIRIVNEGKLEMAYEKTEVKAEGVEDKLKKHLEAGDPKIQDKVDTRKTDVPDDSKKTVPSSLPPGPGTPGFGALGGNGGMGMLGGGWNGLPPGDGEKGNKGKDVVIWNYTNNAPPASLPAYKGYFKPSTEIAQLDPNRKKGGEQKEGEPKDGKSGDKSTGSEKGPGQDKGEDKEDGHKKDPAGEQKPENTGIKKPAPNQQPTPRKIIIRSGELEFEIDSFDTSLTTIMKLVTGTKGGFVATINSDKLANGKVRGSIVVRMPPDQLDQFILDLRKELAKAGELKNQRLGSEDISKLYLDLESRLRAARTMEQRLLNIIKEGKGQIKDLLQAEKELGVWRTKIEEMEGEIRYYNNLVSLATLTIKMYEKDIRTAALVTENERVQAGIEAEDVEKAHKEALKAILDAKGRISRSELKQHAAGQFNAILHFEVSQDAAGPLRDRLKQIGTMVRLQIDRVQVTSNGGTPPKDGKVQRGDTQFLISIYNLANISPRETIVLRIAAADVPAVYQKLRDAISKAKGHVVNANLDEKDRQNINAQLEFNVSRAGQAEVQAALGQAGETLSRQVSRVADSADVTDSKVRYSLVLIDADSIQPRETVTMAVAALDVRVGFDKLKDALAKAKARVIKANLDEQDRRNVSALLEFTFNRKDEGVIQLALTAAGETLARKVIRLPESPVLTDTKVYVHVQLSQADALPPRETVTLKLAATDVADAYEKLRAAVVKAKGRITHATLNEQDRRNVRGTLKFDVPRGDEAAIQALLTAAGEALSRKVERQQENAAVTETKVGFDVELTPAANISPRKTATLALEVSDVPATLRDFNTQVAEVQGRAVTTVVGQENTGQVTARVEFDVPLQSAAGLVDKFKSAGVVRVDRITEDQQAPEGKLALGRIIVTLSNAELLVPREKGFWSQIRNGLAFSLRGLAISANFLIVGLLFVLPWALVIYVAVVLIRRMMRHQTLATAAPEAPAGNVPTAPAG